MEDELVIQRIIEKMYHSITCDRDKKQDWDGFRSVFHSNAILIEYHRPRNKIISVETYIEEMRSVFCVYPEIIVHGFREEETESKLYINMNNAYSVSTYRKQYMLNSRKFDVIGENYIQLIRENDEWRIFSIMWNE